MISRPIAGTSAGLAITCSGLPRACSSSTLQEAASWGKVQTTHEQMVFAEATTVVPLIGSDAYHRGGWKKREKRRWQKLFQQA